MCTHEKEGNVCVICYEEAAVEKVAKQGALLDLHAAKNLLRNAPNGVPWSVERFNKDREVLETPESLLPQTRLANGQAKLPNKGQPLSYYVALARAEKRYAESVDPEHVDEWWDAVQGVSYE